MQSLNADSEERRYEIQGDEIFAKVESYETRMPEAAVLETHRRYVDIQAVLDGGERFECFARERLEIERPYDKVKDAEFYKRITPGPTRVDLTPGSFITFFPHDAHMPGLVIGQESKVVKKVVIKIGVELLTSGAGL
jgi:YhcH/YjgK/YiaL family protein